MTARQSLLLQLISLLVTVVSIFVIFSYTWGKAVQQLETINKTLDKYDDRLNYLERSKS